MGAPVTPTEAAAPVTPTEAAATEAATEAAATEAAATEAASPTDDLEHKVVETTTVEASVSVGNSDKELNEEQLSNLAIAVEKSIRQNLETTDEHQVNIKVDMVQTEIVRRRHLLQWSTTANVVISSSVVVDTRESSPSSSPNSGLLGNVNSILNGEQKDAFTETLKENAEKENLEVSISVTVIGEIESSVVSVPATASPSASPA